MIDPKQWQRSELQDAYERMQKQMDPRLDVRGSWPAFFRWAISQEVRRLENDLLSLDVDTEKGRRRYYEGTAVRRRLKKLIEGPDLGIGHVFEEEIEQCPPPES